jgi:hypothetical protein
MAERMFKITTALIGVPLLLGGCGLAAAAGAQAASDGSFATPEQRFTTPASALKTDEIQVGADSAHAADPEPDAGELAEVTVVARAAGAGVPIFVGIGPKAEVERYLRGTSHDDFVSARLGPLRPSFRRVPGGTAAPPDEQAFWVAKSSGTGTRRLSWDKTSGAWSAVAMRLHASIGLRFGFLAPAATATLTGGTLLLGGTVLAVRRGRRSAARVT